MNLESPRFREAEMEAQYNLRLLRPDYDTAVVPRWVERSRRVRETADCLLDVPYGPSGRTRLDIFRAPGRNNPVLLYFHGGYWQRGSRDIYSFVAEPFVAAGVTVVLAGYDLCPDVTLSELVGQTRAAAAHVWRHAAEWGGDPARITVMGHSAGGHITGVLMGTDWSTVAPDLPRSLFRAAVPISALTELAPLRHTTLNDALQITDREVDALSPINLPPVDDAPQLVVVGGAETAEFHRQSDAYIAAFATPQRLMERYSVPGCDHFDAVNALADPAHAFFARALALITGKDTSKAMASFTHERLATLLAAFNTHDLDRILEHFNEDAVMITPAGEGGNGTRIEGRDNIRAAFSKRFAAQPDIRWNDAVSFIDGDRAFTSWRVQSSAAGTDIAGCDVWTFRNGKVVVKDTFYKQPLD